MYSRCRILKLRIGVETSRVWPMAAGVDLLFNDRRLLPLPLFRFRFLLFFAIHTTQKFSVSRSNAFTRELSSQQGADLIVDKITHSSPEIEHNNLRTPSHRIRSIHIFPQMHPM